MISMDKGSNRAILLKNGVPIKAIERLFLRQHGIKVVNWNILKKDSN